jgi:peptidylprolyl isomerase
MDNQFVTLTTSQGEIEFKLHPEIAPKACENFVTHAENGYYDGVIFHRIIAEFMIQGGDPDGTGMGGKSIWKKPFKDECSAALKFDREGLLAMANSGPGTNGSQFFITCAPASWLNMRHTIFGEVVKGMDVVKKLEGVEVDRHDRPIENQEILKATVRREKVED